MSNAPFHRQVIEHLREGVEELPGGQMLERGAEAIERRVEQGVEMVTDKVGGTARLRVVILLAAVLGLSSADTGAISALAPKLESSLHIGNVDIGLLVTVSGLTAAAGMLPVGWVTDRWKRTHLVTVAVVCWGVAEVMSALAPSYTFLLVVRLALGALTAVTGPTLASLTGDLFPARERSQIYGYILTGELLGAGFGLVVAGLASSWFTWRVAFAVLSIPSFILAWELHKRLPEPARGGQSRLQRGAEAILSAEDIESVGGEAGAGVGASDATAASPSPDPEESEVLRIVRQRRVDPREGVVLDTDPLELGWWESFRYVLAVRSNVTLIVASALGYFFLEGVETFALIYLEGHFGLGEATATLVALAVGGAAVAGAIAGGQVTDRLLAKGRVSARLLVPSACFVIAGVVFAPGIISKTIFVSVPLFLIAGFCIAAPNPGLDAARLDIMPSRIWGRAEAVRSFLRSLLQSFAPLIFGYVSTIFGGKNAGFGVTGGGVHGSGGTTGLWQTFLIMLAALFAAAVIVFLGRKPYPTDVAAAAETERRFPASQDTSPAGTQAGTQAIGVVTAPHDSRGVGSRRRPRP